MSDPGPVFMWAIYDHPKDFPNSFVARQFVCAPAGPVATENIIVKATADEIRDILWKRGLTNLSRDPKDDPAILETWL